MALERQEGYSRCRGLGVSTGGTQPPRRRHSHIREDRTLRGPQHSDGMGVLAETGLWVGRGADDRWVASSPASHLAIGHPSLLAWISVCWMLCWVGVLALTVVWGGLFPGPGGESCGERA